MKIKRLNLAVTSACQLDCRYCGQAAFRAAFPRWQMPLSDVEALLGALDGRRVEVRTFHLTGGEPTEWDHFLEGVRLLADAAPVEIFTNGLNAPAITDAIHYLARVRVSVYEEANNADRARHLRDAFPGKVRLAPIRQRPMPAGPLDDVLPAKCGCPFPTYALGRIYACGCALDRALRLGLAADGPGLSCPVREDFAAFLAEATPQKFRHPTCAICLANDKVWRRLAHGIA